jgi:aryl-alcohol dehydrogenase-like predicted oxidoreductase
LVPVLAAEGVRELPYWALAGGFLTGKYRPGREVESARAKGASEHLKKPENLRLLARLDELAARHAVSVAAIALAWLRAQPTVAAPLASARTEEQLGPLFESVKVTLDAEELASLSAITAP